MFLPAPTFAFQSAETSARNVEKTAVVPEPSERLTTRMSVAGSFAFGFNLAIAASFHFVIFPWKISATVWPSSLIPFSRPLTL